MLNSMTGYSQLEKNEGHVTISAEIRSYNNRYLDIVLRLPQGYAPFESRIKAMISEHIVRGRVELKIQISDNAENENLFEIDEIRAKAYFAALSKLKTLMNLKQDIPLDLVATFNGIIRPVEIETDLEKIWPSVKVCLQGVIDDLVIMRKREGEFIASDFEQRLESLVKRLNRIESRAEGLVNVYKDRLESRIMEMTRGMIELDPARISQEAAFLSEKSDISEEIVRIRSHFEQFKNIMDADEPGGRKLNFLIQELNREMNTIGSKAGNSDISHTIVSMKAELEKLREQVQNIE